MASPLKFLEQLDKQIEAKHLLKHDFYLAWSCGRLSLSCLQDYVKEYNHHIKAFPTYLSAAHARSEGMDVRRSLLNNLIEEEAGSPNHPELWEQFARALGVGEEALAAHLPNPEIMRLIEVFRQACGHGTTAQAVAALYAYESQIPSICVSKIAGLQKYYGMRTPQQWEYFSVHIGADTAHAAEERALLLKLIRPQDQQAVWQTVSQVLDALYGFLTGICQRHQVSCA